MEKKIKVGFIGYGQRGYLINNCISMPDVEVVSVCEKMPHRLKAVSDIVEKAYGKKPYTCEDYHDMIKNVKLDAVIICTSWSAHIPIAIEFLEHGINVGCEVGGCDNLDEIWQLVKAYRKTDAEFMMLENCCYGRAEMLVLNMIKKGLFGDVAYLRGGYHHTLCDEILMGRKNKHYRYNNFLRRNCDNYPTHELGPIAKFVNINRGNRFLSLTSVSSKSVGLNSHAKLNGDKYPDVQNTHFNQGDFISTTIKCANGELISLSLTNTLPLLTSTRNLGVFGTKAFFDASAEIIVESKDNLDYETYPWNKYMGNLEEYYKKYDHPLWKEYISGDIDEGHGGMDYLCLRAFFESIKSKTKPPVDVYDAAALMAVTPLSEMSISLGGKPVEFPDFTYGEWIEEENISRGKYSLNTIEDVPDIPIYPKK